jgi:hypothetical protein
VALIECKQLNIQLSEKHISQLYRYFSVSDVNVAILTNGDDYWFFTDSQKENVMDFEPYYKIRLSEANSEELDKLEQYCKDSIQYADVAQVVQYERYTNECKELVRSLKNNNIPSWILEKLAEKSGIVEMDKPTLAETLYTEIQNQFNGFKVSDKKDKKTEKTSPLGEKMRATVEENKSSKSSIKLNHEYVYNDYSDGGWKFHTIEYAKVFGVKYENISARALLIRVATELFEQDKIKRDEIIKEKQFDGMYKIKTTSDFRGAYYIDGYDVYISTAYGIEDIIKFIDKLLKYASVSDNSVLLSFKD